MKTSHYKLAEQLGQCLLARKLKCTVAESCTGGMLAASITEIPGSSQWFDRAFITYSNRAKNEMLSIAETIINTQGAVSEATAQAMAEGALAHSHADLSAAITGIAGPDGGCAAKPVGTVWIAWAGLMPTAAQHYLFVGDRLKIRHLAVCEALKGMIKRLL